MPIEIHKNGTIVITGEEINVVRFLTIRKALELEIRTGMKASSRFPILRAINKMYGQSFRTKKQALAWMDAVYSEVRSTEYTDTGGAPPPASP